MNEWLNQVDDAIDQRYLSKSILNGSYNFISHQTIYTQYVVTNICDLRMCRLSKFEVYGCQHVCMETLITASKFKEKIQSRFENKNWVSTKWNYSSGAL